jgi:hypothetical protein
VIHVRVIDVISNDHSRWVTNASRSALPRACARAENVKVFDCSLGIVDQTVPDIVQIEIRAGDPCTALVPLLGTSNLVNVHRVPQEAMQLMVCAKIPAGVDAFRVDGHSDRP